MTALVIDLRPVRNAVQQARSLGIERQVVVDRVVADIRAGIHPYRTAQQLQAARLAQSPRGVA